MFIQGERGFDGMQGLPGPKGHKVKDRDDATITFSHEV